MQDVQQFSSISPRTSATRLSETIVGWLRLRPSVRKFLSPKITLTTEKTAVRKDTSDLRALSSIKFTPVQNGHLLSHRNVTLLASSSRQRETTAQKGRIIRSSAATMATQADFDRIGNYAHYHNDQNINPLQMQPRGAHGNFLSLLLSRGYNLDAQGARYPRISQAIPF